MASAVVEHSAHHLKVKGSSPAAPVGTGIEKNGERMIDLSCKKFELAKDKYG
jgi:hypothetical protein